MVDQTSLTVNSNSSDSDRIRLAPSWKKFLLPEFEKSYMKNLKQFLVSELKKGKTIYPKGSETFNAMNLIPLDQVRVVILGQDPYIGPNQAHGLCFSVQEGNPLPPSLQNIFKELKAELDVPTPTHGDLTKWARQGVLLLNTVLTVEKGISGSHHGKGWEQFTDRVIQILNERKEPLVFVLWGSPAQKKSALISNPHHLILKSPHPSPLSAHRGFFGNGHFKRINLFLRSLGLKEIDWSL